MLWYSSFCHGVDLFGNFDKDDDIEEKSDDDKDDKAEDPESEFQIGSQTSWIQRVFVDIQQHYAGTTYRSCSYKPA